MARTPLFALVRNLLQQALEESRTPRESTLPPSPTGAGLNRRDFLKTAGAGAAALTLSPLISACASAGQTKGSAPKVTIVGAGLAGLTCAYYLQKAGIAAQIFEASERIGGRVYTGQDLFTPGTHFELGGELIDSTHDDLMALIKDFGLELLDLKPQDISNPLKDDRVRNAFFFNGTFYSQRAAVEEFKPLASQIAADLKSLPDSFDYRNPGNAVTFDLLSLEEYLDRIGARGWIRQLLVVAYTTEFGLEPGHLSALNLIKAISTDTTTPELSLFGSSDERYTLRNGNERLIEQLRRRLACPIETGHQLAAIRQDSSGKYLMDFIVKSGPTLRVESRVVVLALPFSTLRHVQNKVALPSLKSRAIRELGYGTNSKLLMGFHKPAWRDVGLEGSSFTDASYQSTWDSSRGRGFKIGALTFYLGGKIGLEVNRGAVSDHAHKFLHDFEKLLAASPHAPKHRTQPLQPIGDARRIHWPSHPTTLGSYASYKPGQWTGFGGVEGKTVGHLYFAGEHCSPDFQGFMNGAVQSGRFVAEEIVAQESQQAFVSFLKTRHAHA